MAKIPPTTPPLATLGKTVPVAEGVPRKAAARPEAEAHERAIEAQRQIQKVEQDLDRTLDYLRDQYERENAAESERHETQVENQRLKGYQKLRELQREQGRELERVRSQGEQQLTQTQNHYRNTLYEAEKRGKTQLDSLQQSQAERLDYEQKNSAEMMESARADNAQKFERFQQQKESQLSETLAASRAEYERLHEHTNQATQQAQEKFEQRFNRISGEHDEILERTLGDANQKLQNIRQETSEKLAAYGIRQRDPFYRMVSLDAELVDKGDAYVLTATIPEHEQAGISVSMRGNQLVISGHRRNHEKTKDENGRESSTASYQSFHESFPLDLPVEAKKLSRVFNGDELIVSVPKAGKAHEKYVSPAKATVARARVERPDFPDNLPREDRKETQSAAPRSPRLGKSTDTLG